MSFRQGARQFFERRGGGGWQNPYVTDGLVAMWDGEWNAGGGVHDPSATTWKDLTGNDHDGELKGCMWESNRLKITNNNDNVIIVNTIPLNDQKHIEIVFNKNTSAGVAFVANFMKSTSEKYIALRGSGTALFYGNGGYNFIIDPTIPASYSFDYSHANKLLVNGIEMTSTTTGGSFSGPSSAGFNLYAASFGGYYPFAGQIYGARIYNRSLSSAERLANYAVDAQRFGIGGN